MSITLEDIFNAENAVKTVRVKLAEIGREIYKMRNGEELDLRYSFHEYERFNFSGPEYSGQHGPDWGKGKPVIAMNYFWSYQGGGDAVTITMPMGWIGQDWRALEARRLEKEREAKSRKDAVAKKAKDAKAEEKQRRDYEALKAKFEAPQS